MENFYREKAYFMPGKLRIIDFAPSEKYSSYTTGPISTVINNGQSNIEVTQTGVLMQCNSRSSSQIDWRNYDYFSLTVHISNNALVDFF